MGMLREGQSGMEWKKEVAKERNKNSHNGSTNRMIDREVYILSVV